MKDRKFLLRLSKHQDSYRSRSLLKLINESIIRTLLPKIRVSLNQNFHVENFMTVLRLLSSIKSLLITNSNLMNDEYAKLANFRSMG